MAGDRASRGDPRRTRPGGQTVGEVPTVADRWAVPILAIVAGLIGAAASGEPTVHPGLDACLRFALAAGVTVAASQARQFAWIVLAGVTAAASAELGVGTVGFVALGLAALSIIRGWDRPWLGASIALLSTTAMLRLPDVGPHGATALVAAIAIAPVLVSAYRSRSARSVQSARRLRASLLVVGAVIVIATAGLVGALVIGGSNVSDGTEAARAGVRAAKEGDVEASEARLDDAVVAFANADGAFDSPLTWPAQVVPGLSQQVAAMQQMSAVGRDLTVAASEVAGTADFRSIPVDDGLIDIERIASFAGPLDDIDSALSDAQADIDAVDPSWLVPPLARDLEVLRAEVRTAAEETRTAVQAVAVAPDLLGADGPRRYFVAFTTPAESRGTGGFVGSWAELTVDGGRLDLTRSGRGVDLVPGPDEPLRSLDATVDYQARYGPLRVEEQVRDVTLSPDFPSVAQAIESIYPQTEGGQPVDGVILIDPYAIAAMLRITGPIRVEGYDLELTEDNAADVLLRRQYLDFEGSNDDRVDFLDEASRKTFNRFIRSKTLRPAQLARVFGPLVDEGRLLLWSARADEQRLVERLGADGAFPYRASDEVATIPDPSGAVVTERQAQPKGGGEQDFFALATNNAGNNKIDIYLSRSVDYAATYDPDTGSLRATATVVLRNDAPSSGLPGYVIRNRNDSGQPDGTNWLWFNFYSPHRLTSATLDGQPMPLSAGYEFGLNVYDRYLAVPPGGSTTVVLELEGSLRPDATYRVGTYRQPLVNRDEVTASVTPSAPWRGSSTAAGGAVALTVPDGRDPRVEVQLGGG